MSTQPRRVAAWVGTCAALALAAGCSSWGVAHVRIDEETTIPTRLRVNDDATVDVDCAGNDTIVRLGKSRFVFLDHRGHYGDVGVARGDLVVGGVRFRYDGLEAWAIGEDGGGQFFLACEQDVMIHRDGMVAEVRDSGGR